MDYTHFEVVRTRPYDLNSKNKELMVAIVKIPTDVSRSILDEALQRRSGVEVVAKTDPYTKSDRVVCLITEANSFTEQAVLDLLGDLDRAIATISRVASRAANRPKRRQRAQVYVNSGRRRET